MNKICQLILAAALMVAGFGCSSLEVSQDYEQSYNFSILNTFAWQDPVQEKTGDILADSNLIHERIRSAVEKNLLIKGIRKTQGLPDFYIQYTYVIDQKIQSTPVTTGIGMGYGSHRRMGGIGLSTGSDVRQYNQGLLVVDFLEPATQKLLWRGTSTREVTTHSTPEKTRQEIDETITALLAQFPPS